MKHKLILPVVVVAVIIAAGAGLIVHANQSNKTDPSFPVGSTMAVAKTHSKGTLPACLTKVAGAETAVRKDDKLIGGQNSAFDVATTMGIIDVPAGTNVDASIHSYDGKTVTGSIAYPPRYGSYNFKIVPSSATKPYSQWNMTSLSACMQS